MADEFASGGKALVLGTILSAPAAIAADVHPLMSSDYWLSLGVYLPSRDFGASAVGSAGVEAPLVDFERSLGVTDRPDLFNIEFGWQFGKEWGLSMQYFDSERSRLRTLETAIEWEGVTYDAGIDALVRSTTEITRVFFSRDFRNSGQSSLRLGAGLHYIETSAEISGEATLDDMSTEFRRGVVSSAFPVPNIGAWYRYSPSARWLLSARADWFSADVGDFSGSIWNIAAAANYSLTGHIGAGLSYQFFEIDGSVRETGWTGGLRTRFDGPVIYLAGFW